MTAGLSVVTNALTKVLGGQMLRDVQTFVAAFDTLFGGFRQRAEKTFALLQADGTAFVVVAAPEPDALREAAYFVDRLTDEDMPLAGLVVNRASPSARTELSAEAAITAADRLQSGDSSSLTAGLLRLHADRVRIIEREQHLRERFAAAHPKVPTAVVPAMAERRPRPRRPARAIGDEPGRPATEPARRSSDARLGRGSLDLGAGGLEDGAPRRAGATAEQRTALTLGHPAPDAPLDLVVQRLGEALGPDGASRTDLLGLVLLCATHEQRVRRVALACGACCPVLDPHKSNPTVIVEPVGRPHSGHP